MMGRLLGLAGLLLGIAGGAYAQSTAQPVVMGYLATSGCPSGQATCFQQVDAAHPLPSTATASIGNVSVTATATPTVAPGTNNGTISAANTSQQLFSSSVILHGFDLTNTSANETMYISFGSNATVGTSQPLAPGQSYHFGFPSSVALNVAAATVGHPFTYILF